MSAEDFIRKAKETHGDKYDYSKVIYTNSKDKVCIICSKHGEFWQTPNKHLHGQGCPKCGGRKQLTTEEFIKKAKAIHGDKYNYSKVVYENSNTKVCIICPEHGEFWQSPNAHLSGKGCAKCASGAVRTTEDFIKKARIVHNDKYDYDKVEYINAKTKVCIICPEHGEFWQTPSGHLMGKGCKKCGNTNGHNLLRLSKTEFINKSKEVHGNIYDYSKAEYVDNKTKVCIICPEHGEFWQVPFSHLKGAGCPKCAFENTSKNKTLTTDNFILKSKAIHGDKYNYSKVEYIDSHTKVCIICPEHGEFWQTPNNHLNGKACPNCQGFRKQYKFNLLQEFKDEYEFRAFLENNDVNMLYFILDVIEQKYKPLESDIRKALLKKDEISPIKALEDKYSSDYDTDDDDDTFVEGQTTIRTSVVDLDDDAIDNVLPIEEYIKEPQSKITIEDVIKNTEKEIKVINKIEHLLTPEVRKYIMDKFLNDKRRAWMLKRECSVK